MEEIAQKGNSDVQYNLGLIYSNGEDVERDISKAIFWFKKSASQDNVLAQYKLGCYSYFLYRTRDGSWCDNLSR